MTELLHLIIHSDHRMKATCNCREFDVHDCEYTKEQVIAIPQERPPIGIKTNMIHNKCCRPVNWERFKSALEALDPEEWKQLIWM